MISAFVAWLLIMACFVASALAAYRFGVAKTNKAWGEFMAAGWAELSKVSQTRTPDVSDLWAAFHIDKAPR